MKKITILILFLGLSGIVFAQSPPPIKVKLKSPQQTFNTLVKAIKRHDLKAYKKCWDKKSLEREGMYSKLKANPDKVFEELKAGFKGELKLKREHDNIDLSNGAMCKKYSQMNLVVEAPEAEEGGPGSISMIRKGSNWKMKSW